MNRYTDAHIEHYADRFIALRLARHGVNLEQYLANVERFERLALENEPLLAAQHAPVLRLWAEADTGLARESRPGHVAPHWSDAILQDPHELVARWRAESDAAEREVEHLTQRNGAYVEPLRHHCHPPRSKCSFFNKRGA